mmetsp:Transcript_41401/g.96708  ORF Transcript_41401/g.96708 Transcript_41401/m.96708 type:complete len:537 (+) Transcript_41401:37-1647(+)
MASLLAQRRLGGTLLVTGFCLAYLGLPGFACWGACGPKRQLARHAVADVETHQEVDQAADAQVSVLRALAAEGRADDAEDALYEIIDAGIKPRAAHFAAIISSCAPGKDTERAERWLFRMRALEVGADPSVYHALMRVAAEAGNSAAAEQWMNEAWEEGFQPDRQSFEHLLRSLRTAGDTVNVEMWFERLMEMQVPPDIAMVNEVIGIFADQDRMDKAAEWMEIARNALGLAPDVETYKLVITAHARSGHFEEAEMLFEQMLSQGIRPPASAYALLTGDGRSSRSLQAVEKWCSRLQEAEVEIDGKTYTDLIGAWAKLQKPSKAQEWFSKMLEEGKATAEALALLVDALVLSDVQGNVKNRWGKRKSKGKETAEEWIARFRDTGKELSPGVYAARASADVFLGDYEQVEARMQQMEVDGLEIDEDALTMLLLAYAYAEPRQTLLAEQMFKQQMLRGKVRATREVLEALRTAVGGARCLELRRELKIGTTRSPGTAIEYEAKSVAGKNRNPRHRSGRSRIWKRFLPAAPPVQRLKWE